MRASRNSCGAPTNEAFTKLPPGALDGLLKDKAKLKAVLQRSQCVDCGALAFPRQ